LKRQELRRTASIRSAKKRTIHPKNTLYRGRAAELAGIPQVEFLLALERYKVFPLEAELRDLENAED
jgi:hypothetical protein